MLEDFCHCNEIKSPDEAVPLRVQPQKPEPEVVCTRSACCGLVYQSMILVKEVDMEQLREWVQYFQEHIGAAIIVGGVVAVGVFLLFRRPKTIRDADKRLRELRDERAPNYRNLRPPN